jgi:indolepyruvate ferredoxin oxidoreductase alpha subunit
MPAGERLLLSGNQAVALSALHHGFALGVGYPGTPSTEILETLAELGGRAEWAPNEKVALEVGLGAAYARARALVTMKHVGLNVAADPLFTAAYTGVTGALVVVSADDPGMASSQNEQDNRRYAVAAGVPMLEPSSSAEAYDFLARAAELSESYGLPVLLRMTTRVCHSQSVVVPRPRLGPPPPPHFERDIAARVMLPSNARPAHRRLRDKLERIRDCAEESDLCRETRGSPELGIVTSGVTALHAREAAPEASVLELGLTHPLPLGRIGRFVASVRRCLVLEEGDPYLYEALRTHGLSVSGKPEAFRFGELDVGRVRRILDGDVSPEPAPPRGKPPELCKSCPHRSVFELLRRHDLIVSGDIGCYTLGALPPFEAMDSCVCMGAAIGVGRGLRSVLPDAEAARVVSVIGDSTFVHSGLTGIVDMVYNRPATGHVVLILDNGTTAMTGQQEHPATGRSLGHDPAPRLSLEQVCRAIGVGRVEVIDPVAERTEFERTLLDMLDRRELAVLIARRACLLLPRKLQQHRKLRQLAGPREPE